MKKCRDISTLFDDWLTWKTSHNNMAPIYVVIEKLYILIKNENGGGKVAYFLTFPLIPSATAFC